jgi:acyl-coenzyme A synthetase/AMP-(fatty) acid ligase
MLAPFKRLRYYKFIDDLPLTATGKKMHYVIKEQADAALEKGELERV